MTNKLNEAERSVRPFGAEVVPGKQGDVKARPLGGKVAEHSESDRSTRPFGADLLTGKQGDVKAQPVSQQKPPTSK